MKCSECGQQFEYLQGEQEAYARFDFNMPPNCPECRQRRRLAFRNEKKLYYNQSFMSGKKIIALYPEESPFRVVDHDEWWSDKFDATVYGKDFDFSRPFFEQYAELQKEVPRWPRIVVNCDNCDFCNNCADCKNCYLSFSSYESEDVHYGIRVYTSKDCLDCFHVYDGEYCSNCLSCRKCYNVHYSQLAENSSDSYFLFDCKSCNNCILCAGLRNQSYMVLNKQYTKDEYELYKKEFLGSLNREKSKILKTFEELKEKIPHRNLQITNSENCMGDYIGNSKNLVHSFYATKCEECVNIYNCYNMKTTCDGFSLDRGELCTECDTSFETYNCAYTTYVATATYSQYCDQCFYVDYCFGCIGLKRQKYMILNKRYSKEDYEKMIIKIKEHMKRTGEWGHPFPYQLSPFAYNQTVAYDTYPLTKNQVLSSGLMWYESKEEAKYFGQDYKIPDNVNEVDESICDRILICEKTGKNYKIIPHELEFYKKFNLPLPRTCPDERYRELLNLQNPHKLRDANCSECKKEIKTSYSANTTYKIVCEECYLKQKY